MNLTKCLLAVVTMLILTSQSFAQPVISEDKDSQFRLSQLRQSAAIEKEDNMMRIETTSASKSKSPALALLYSLILPGAGHWYLDRMDVGKYFLTADAISWTGLIALNVHGDNVMNDAESYSVEHADVTDPDSRDEDFYINIGNYNSVYDYNNDKLSRGEYNLLYDVNSNYWNWDDVNNRNIFESQREKSERIYNNRIIFTSLLLVNRVVSGISAFLIAKNTGSSKSYSVAPSLLYKKDMSFDGIKVNLQTTF